MSIRTPIAFYFAYPDADLEVTDAERRWLEAAIAVRASKPQTRGILTLAVIHVAKENGAIPDKCYRYIAKGGVWLDSKSSLCLPFYARQNVRWDSEKLIAKLWAIYDRDEEKRIYTQLPIGAL